VRSGDRWLRSGTPQQCLVLSFLALCPGQVVPAGQLIDAVWDGDPPRSAHNSIQVVLTHLRKALARTSGARLARCGGGYRLDADPGRIDVHHFRSLVRAGRGAGDAGSAVSLLDQALTLWKGPALADAADTAKAGQIRVSLGHERLAALEDRTDALLRCGRDQEAVAQLPGLVAEHPLREKLAELLMLALYRTGRQAEALDAYQQARSTLVAELGIEPGEELRLLQQRILANDPGLLSAVESVTATSTRARSLDRDSGDVRRGHSRAGYGYPAVPHPRQSAPTVRHGSRVHRARWGPVVPHQLPAVVPHFIGRDAELSELDSMVSTVAGDGSAVVISAVAGMAGVGKTALAVRWAHQVAAEFPDGQLYVNLRGFGPEGEPVRPATAVRGFLDALGVPPEEVPASTPAQAGLYRSLLAGRRMLLLFDNAQNEAQVRPLLPPGSSCRVVVTSRTRLTGLAATEGARLVTLDVLAEEEARQMLGRRLGEGRMRAEPDAAAELISLCGRLPLALAIIAARAADRPDFPLAGLVAELRERQRLGALDTGEEATSVQAVFSWSYQQLGVAAARMFRLLGLPPGPDLPGHAAARLAGLPSEQAHDLLQSLVRGCLLTEPRPDRYALHDLLRVYASQEANRAESSGERAQVLTRLFEHYLAVAGAAMDTLGPAERHQRPKVGQPDASAPPVDTPQSARSWLDAERTNLVAIARHTSNRGWPGHTTRLAAILFRYLDDGGHYSDGFTVHTCALHAAQQSGDRTEQADALRRRGGIDFRQGRCEEAATQLAQALVIYRDLRDRVGQGRALNNLGIVLRAGGRFEEALNHHEQALAIFREEGDEFGEALTLDALGVTSCRVGRYQQSAQRHREALEQFRQMGELRSAAFAVGNLGATLRRLGRLEEANECHQQGLALNRQLDCRYGEAEALTDLGALRLCQGRYQHAAEYHDQALALFQALGAPRGEAAALNGLGEAMTALGRPADARAQHHGALALVTQVTDRYQVARAHDGLAHAHKFSGDTDLARRHWEQALAHYREMGVPAASQAHMALPNLAGCRQLK
jgi:DNA-binding SARP family transcriptional activator/tetratricopeptide (TPR) repeat protein